MIPWDEFLGELLPRHAPQFIAGLAETLRLTGAAFCIAVGFGTPLALLRRERVPFASSAVAGYVNGVRMFPLLTWLYLAYFGLPAVGLTLDSFEAAALALGVYGSAQVAEIVRAAFDAIDKGQEEAGHTLGLLYLDRLWFILRPQALRLLTVGVGNYAIWLLKDTALASTVAVFELMTSARTVIFETYLAFQVYLFVAVLYLVISLGAALAIRRLERRWGIAELTKRHPAFVGSS